MIPSVYFYGMIVTFPVSFLILFIYAITFWGVGGV